MQALSREEVVEMAQKELIEMLLTQAGKEPSRKAAEEALRKGLSKDLVILAASMADFATTDGTFEDWFLYISSPLVNLAVMGVDTGDHGLFDATGRLMRAGLFPWTETTI